MADQQSNQPMQQDPQRQEANDDKSRARKQVQEAKKATKPLLKKKFSDLSKDEMRSVLTIMTRHEVDPDADVATILKTVRASQKAAAATDAFDLPNDSSDEEPQQDFSIPSLKHLAAKQMTRVTCFSGKWGCDPAKADEYCAGLVTLMNHVGDASNKYIKTVKMWVESNASNPAIAQIVTTINEALAASTNALPVDADELHQLVYAMAFPFLTEEQAEVSLCNTTCYTSDSQAYIIFSFLRAIHRVRRCNTTCYKLVSCTV
jgi:hypothetical protein